MVYRFGEDHSGHVVAEKRAHETVESFLDLHYPASDIPAQARELYCKNLVRYIPDATYTPQPLWPVINPKSGRPLDLSLSMLRSVSTIHLEYLGNMGVRASVSLSLVIGGKLWGLIACHARTPLYLNCRLRLALEVFAQLASLHLRTTLELQEATERLKMREVHHRLNLAMNTSGLAEALVDSRPNLLDLIAAAGVAVRVDEKNFTLGCTPSDQAITDLAVWLNATKSMGVFHTDQIQVIYPAAAPFVDVSAGILALSVSRQPRDYVIWFLPEVVSTVKWAGDPGKPVVSGPRGERLTPRKSFEVWSETKRGRSRPWRPAEVEAAHLLRTSILEVVLHQIYQANRERSKAKRDQDLLLAELDHRVKNTIAAIQALVQVSSRSAESLIGFTKSIEKRLHAMAKAHNLLSASRWTSASLQSLLEDEIGAYRSESRYNIALDGPNYMLEPQTALSFSLVLHELLTNAVKHGSLSKPEGALRVTWEKTNRNGKDWLTLTWLEFNGPIVRKPTRRGFGRTLLERVFAADVGGGVSLAFQPEGVSCVIEIPFAKVVGEDAVAQASIGSDADGAMDVGAGILSGIRILVVEDDIVIGMNLVDGLVEADATVVGPFTELAKGLAGAVECQFDIALLDVNLNGKPSWPIASLLTDQDIPIIFLTGYSDSAQRPERFREIPTLLKPYSVTLVVEKVRKTVEAVRKEFR
jgi:light-regulated signal transduction histidine kinase (bacteriophytochrome)